MPTVLGSNMIKIVKKWGFWLNGADLAQLITESCSNPDCKGPKLYYPAGHNKPRCSSCGKYLIGPQLLEGHGKRMAYHLEV